MGFTKEIKYSSDFAEAAKKLKSSYGVTNLFSTGNSALDKYLGGGYGRKGAYEIVLIFGPTGIGKSTVGLNLLAPAIKAGKKVGLLVLEDDMADVMIRLEKVLGEEGYEKMNKNRNVFCIPPDALERSWSLVDLLAYIEEWFNVLKMDLIFFDHLQMAFEGADAIKGENEYIAQRVFMQKLNHLMKKVNKTIILVSHINKASASKGMDKIVGSSSISQAATKVIEIGKEDIEDGIKLMLHKSRFTKLPGFHYSLRLIDGKFQSAATKPPIQPGALF